jgi:hypothetical protein
MLGADLAPDGIRVATLTIAGQIAPATAQLDDLRRARQPDAAPTPSSPLTWAIRGNPWAPRAVEYARRRRQGGRGHGLDQPAVGVALTQLRQARQNCSRFPVPERQRPVVPEACQVPRHLCQGQGVGQLAASRATLRHQTGGPMRAPSRQEPSHRIAGRQAEPLGSARAQFRLRPCSRVMSLRFHQLWTSSIPWSGSCSSTTWRMDAWLSSPLAELTYCSPVCLSTSR